MVDSVMWNDFRQSRIVGAEPSFMISMLYGQYRVDILCAM